MGKNPFFINLARLYNQESGERNWGSFIRPEPGDEPGQITIVYVPEGSFSEKKIRNVPADALKDVPTRFAPPEGAKVLVSDGSNPSFLKWLDMDIAETIEHMRREITNLKARESSAEAQIKKAKMGEKAIFKDYYEKRQLAARTSALKPLPSRWRGREEDEEIY